MSPRFLFSLREWPHAVQQALSYLNEAPIRGETRSVDFSLGPPSIGRLPLEVCIDGRKALLCELRDTKGSFLYEIRGWLERCLECDFDGNFHPEFLTLDCRGMVLCFLMIHVGWEEFTEKPISYLTAVRQDRGEPVFGCFCLTIETIAAFYQALIRCLKRYRHLFNNPSRWYDIKRFDLLDERTSYDRLMDQVRSQKIEFYCKKSFLK